MEEGRRLTDTWRECLRMMGTLVPSERIPAAAEAVPLKEEGSDDDGEEEDEEEDEDKVLLLLLVFSLKR